MFYTFGHKADNSRIYTANRKSCSYKNNTILNISQEITSINSMRGRKDIRFKGV
jgi:hypothetical protein